MFPHGLHVDRDGNVWVTDGLGKDGKGHQVFKFGPDGKVLMRLGKAGVAGDGPDEFNAPSAVLVAPNGDIFVADGHGGNTNARIVKFSQDGKFIKSWGKKGSSPGEFDTPHALAMDSQRAALRRRPSEQPHPDFRPGRKLHRSVVPIQPPERRVHRCGRHDLRGRFGIGVGVKKSRRLETRDQNRQESPTDGWQHSFPTRRKRRRPPVPPRASRQTLRATSLARKSGQNA